MCVFETYRSFSWHAAHSRKCLPLGDRSGVSQVSVKVCTTEPLGAVLPCTGGTVIAWTPATKAGVRERMTVSSCIVAESRGSILLDG